jgi:thymidylate kinase
MFIIVEGIDLVGKTTQAAMMVDHLRTGGRYVVSYSLPAYDSPTGRAISDHLRANVALTVQDGTLGLSNISEHDSLAFQCLQLADKYAVAPEISRHLAAGRDAVACRWWQSSVTYGAETGVDEGWTSRACALLPRADVNVLLDLDPAKARRRPGASLDRLEAELAQQARIRRRYLDLWQRDGGEHGLWVVVDAEGEAEEVHGRILAVLRASGVALRGAGFTGEHTREEES